MLPTPKNIAHVEKITQTWQQVRSRLYDAKLVLENHVSPQTIQSINRLIDDDPIDAIKMLHALGNNHPDLHLLWKHLAKASLILLMMD